MYGCYSLSGESDGEQVTSSRLRSDKRKHALQSARAASSRLCDLEGRPNGLQVSLPQVSFDLLGALREAFAFMRLHCREMFESTLRPLLFGTVRGVVSEVFAKS